MTPQSFAYTLLEYIEDEARLGFYFFPAAIVKALGAEAAAAGTAGRYTWMEIALALDLLTEIGPLGKRRDGRYYIRRCVGCGCTWRKPCRGGCSWVSKQVCSQCRERGKA